MKNLVLLILAAALFSGCGLPGARIKPGNITSRLGTGATVTQVQPQDPKDRSNLNQESERTVELTLPPGSAIVLDAAVLAAVPGSPVTNQTAAAGTRFVVSDKGAAVYRTVTKDKVTSSIGAAQKNNLADTVAKLQNLSWLTWLGAAVSLCGLASFFYAPLKVVVPTNCAVAAIVAGVGFIALPSLLVGHELLILSGLGAALLIYFLAHHQAAVSSELKTFKGLFAASPAPAVPAPEPPATS